MVAAVGFTMNPCNALRWNPFSEASSISSFPMTSSISIHSSTSFMSTSYSEEPCVTKSLSELVHDYLLGVL